MQIEETNYIQQVEKVTCSAFYALKNFEIFFASSFTSLCLCSLALHYLLLLDFC